MHHAQIRALESLFKAFENHMPVQNVVKPLKGEVAACKQFF
jgi:hypothetical protein